MIVIYSLVSFFAQKVIPYLGFFPYKELLVEYGLPSWISSFANFDGIHYLLIAKQNYSQWEQAFFPLYPLFIHIVGYIIPNYLVGALFISNCTLLFGLVFFNKFIRELKIKTSWPLFFLLSFPTAFYFGMVYTESLFFILLILSLFFLHKKRYVAAGIFAGLSSATRLIGIFLIIPFFFHFLTDIRNVLKNTKPSAFNFVFVLISPFIGLISYMGYLWKTTGDPLFFFNSQPIFGANRSTHLITLPQVYYRYIKILLTATHDFQWYLSLFEMSMFSLVFVVLILDFLKIKKQLSAASTNLRGLQRLGLNIFSFINIVLPTATGTFSSIPRYALFSLSFFIFLGELKSPTLKSVIIAIFALLQIAILSLFVQGYFVG